MRNKGHRVWKGPQRCITPKINARPCLLQWGLYTSKFSAQFKVSHFWQVSFILTLSSRVSVKACLEKSTFLLFFSLQFSTQGTFRYLLFLSGFFFSIIFFPWTSYRLPAPITTLGNKCPRLTVPWIISYYFYCCYWYFWYLLLSFDSS